VPLNNDTMDVLARRMKSAGRLVFTRGDGLKARIRQIDKRDLERACQSVSIKDFYWHDLRHTWASWHVQAGTPLMVLKELGGWETIQMVQKSPTSRPATYRAMPKQSRFGHNTKQKHKRL
jgi:integrase